MAMVVAAEVPFHSWWWSTSASKNPWKLSLTRPTFSPTTLIIISGYFDVCYLLGYSWGDEEVHCMCECGNARRGPVVMRGVARLRYAIPLTLNNNPVCWQGRLRDCGIWAERTGSSLNGGRKEGRKWRLEQVVGFDAGVEVEEVVAYSNLVQQRLIQVSCWGWMKWNEKGGNSAGDARGKEARKEGVLAVDSIRNHPVIMHLPL